MIQFEQTKSYQIYKTGKIGQFFSKALALASGWVDISLKFSLLLLCLYKERPPPISPSFFTLIRQTGSLDPLIVLYVMFFVIDLS